MKEKGLEVVDATVRKIMTMVEINRLVGYEKFPITEHLREVGDLIADYGIGDAPINDMSLMLLEDMQKRLMDTDEGEKTDER